MATSFIKCSPILCFVLLLPAFCIAQETFVNSRATFYGSPECYGNPTGACGFGDYGRTVNDGKVSGVSRLYRNGSGCGACYQVRCKVPGLCSEDGAYVVVTDYGAGDHTDFVLSARAFANLATPNNAYDLMAYGVVDVEFKRVSCQYPSSNLLMKVHERSTFPHYLAIIVLYPAGQYDVLSVDIWQEEYQSWRCMRRAFGAVFDSENPPRGPLSIRVQVSGSDGMKYVLAKSPIPSDWKAGVAYDSEVQLD